MFGIIYNKVVANAYWLEALVFPTLIPSFNEHTVETMLGGIVDVSLHVLVVGSVATVRFQL